VKQIRVTNPTVTAATVRLFANGTTTPFEIMPTTTIQPGEFLVDDGTVCLAAAGTIGATIGTATSLVVSIFGMEIT
jgi:hypothetical protein